MALNLNKLGSPSADGSYDFNSIDEGALQLFKKTFGTEVDVAFDSKTIMEPRTRTKTLEYGKGHEFPLLSNIEAYRHTPGTDIQGQDFNRDTRFIRLDNRLVTATHVAQIDDLMNHTDERSLYSSRMGYALAKQYDRSVMAEVIKGARKDTPWGDNSQELSGFNGGTLVTNDNLLLDSETTNDGTTYPDGDTTSGASSSKDKADALAAGIREIARTFDEKDAPQESRIVIVKPREYYALFDNLDYINENYGGRGSIAEGNIMRLFGIQIMMSNLLPIEDLSGSSDPHLNADYRKNVGIGIAGPDAVATVKLLGLNFDTNWDFRNKTWQMDASYIVGHGWLRPELCAQLALGKGEDSNLVRE